MSNSTAFLSSVNELTNAIDSFWIMVAGILVFFMQAGFAMLESSVNLKTHKISC